MIDCVGARMRIQHKALHLEIHTKAFECGKWVESANQEEYIRNLGNTHGPE